MGKILCLGEVALHNWTEYLVKEKYITHYNRGCLGGFDFTTTYSFEPSHRIYDKKYLLFCMVLFDKIITSSLSNFVYDKIVETGIIDDNFFTYRFDQSYEKNGYYQDIAINFIEANKKSLINYLSRDIVHSSKFQVNPEQDYLSFLQNPHCEGIQKHFNPNVLILTQIRDAMEAGLSLSQESNVIFYNGRLSYKNRKHEIPLTSSKLNDYANYILQLDLTPEINQFPLPQNMVDVLYLRKQPEIISFREVFFSWINYIAAGDYDIASKIKKDVISANSALEKYRNFEKKKTNLFYCTIDALLGQIPYLSNLLSFVSPYSFRETLKSKNKNSWVSLLK